MKFIQEFRDFAIRGNVIDMGIGVVIGTAFTKVVDSLVRDMLMPPIGYVLGKVDFSHLFISLSGETFKSVTEAKEAGAATINYGTFLNTLLDFGIISLTIFIVIRQLNRLKKTPVIDWKTNQCPYCLQQIPAKAARCPHCTSVLNASQLRVVENAPKIVIR
ncbi:large conductance mechanosensitive channel protein MscL [Bacillus sp. HMF5848]|uniref:large conductance mechanosensitive channel protein MscL n=1 Tax=Bacillus sp. HMF5848 TaxID=2495421 RepID=UPI000F7AFABE|nr:large conductance mechanosensitive channel protein MscL [Bacillus sp. HMF5848]RSK25659.1 large conductance mechanosensitive channel protein MscL [Bacillus sp. HMF5848]